VQARRAAAELQLEADSIELVVVSPFATQSVDEATVPLRRQWPGRVRLVRLAARNSRDSASVALEAGSADPVQASFALSARRSTGVPSIRLIRERGRIDTAWVRAGGAAVEWPTDARPAGWEVAADSVTAVISDDGAVVFPFQRTAALVPSEGGLVEAHWIDGTPASRETRLGAGCIRQVAVPVTSRGDFVLRPDFQRLFRRLIAPCAHQRPVVLLPAPQLALLAGDGPLVSRDALQPPEAPETPLVPWLFALAFLLMLAELWVRRRPAEEVAVPAPLDQAA
jgi:hypothetical protein